MKSINLTDLTINGTSVIVTLGAIVTGISIAEYASEIYEYVYYTLPAITESSHNLNLIGEYGKKILSAAPIVLAEYACILTAAAGIKTSLAMYKKPYK